MSPAKSLEELSSSIVRMDSPSLLNTISSLSVADIPDINLLSSALNAVFLLNSKRFIKSATRKIRKLLKSDKNNTLLRQILSNIQSAPNLSQSVFLGLCIESHTGRLSNEDLNIIWSYFQSCLVSSKVEIAPSILVSMKNFIATYFDVDKWIEYFPHFERSFLRTPEISIILLDFIISNMNPLIPVDLKSIYNLISGLFC